MHSFINDTLTSKGRVTMQKYGHGLFALGVAPVELFSLYFALKENIKVIKNVYVFSTLGKITSFNKFVPIKNSKSPEGKNCTKMSFPIFIKIFS